MKTYNEFYDSGKTKLHNGKTVPKDHPVIEMLGTIDELNSIIGFILSKKITPVLKKILLKIQKELLLFCSGLIYQNTSMDFKELENLIDQLEVKLEQLNKFIIPGGTESAALLHLARTVCRRAERRLITLIKKENVEKSRLAYINRLSDLLFVMARYENNQAGIKELSIEDIK